jgi:flagellar biosynthesis/type III secretory pathway M-ring protein FliF/YscJ
VDPDLAAALGALIALFGLAAAVLAADLSRRARRLIEAQEGAETPQARADRLSRVLREAVDVIEEFRAEIAQGQQTADRLQEDIERYKELAKLGQEDVEAVARILRTELEEESGRSFRRDLLMNGGFLVVGVGLTILVTALIGG